MSLPPCISSLIETATKGPTVVVDYVFDNLESVDGQPL